jgi:hypothetical protein
MHKAIDKHRGSRTHFPHLVGKSEEELEENKVKKEVQELINKMTLEKLKALKILLT